MEKLFGFKELYDVSIKATYPIIIGETTYEKDETIISFDSVMLATVNEDKTRRAATGGFGNRELIFWEETTEVGFSLSKGIISKEGFSLISNSKLLTIEQNTLRVEYKETKETNEEGNIVLKYTPITTEPIFIYNAETGEKISNYTLKNNTVSLTNPYKEYIIEYTFLYENKVEKLKVGDRAINGFLRLTGKMRLKDEFDGHDKTAIIEIPRIKFMSDLSLRLGETANPQVNTFYITGYPPIESRKEKTVCEIIFLDNDIDSDF